MAETMNMMEVTIEKFTDLIKMDLEDENYEPIIGLGKSGVGKTMSIYELTQQMGIGFCELRLVTLTETDMLGIPTITEDGRTTYASNDLLPNVKRDGERGILVLDEITSAQSTVRAAAYQLLDSKRALGNYKLPDGWKVVALGNGIEDGGVFQGMEAAFLSRAMCYRIEPNLETWKKWAIRHGVNPSIIAYLTFDPTKLHEFDPDELASVFPCPRSWVALSKRLNAREQKAPNHLLSTEDVELYAAGAVGINVASAFAGFYSYNSKTIAPEDILSGKAKGSIVDEVDTEVVYLMIQSMIKQLNTELEAGHSTIGSFKPECIERTANLCKWIVDVADHKLDYAVVCIRDMTQGVPLFAEMLLMSDEFDEKCPEFAQFAKDNGVVFRGN
jgi:hypothetical protein